jgi:hypothetical protein
MIALQVAQRVLGMFPSFFIGVGGTQAAPEPLLLVNAKEDPEHLSGRAVIVLAGLVAGHAARQGSDRYAPYKDGWQKADCG